MKYNNLINELLIIQNAELIEQLDNQLVKMSKNPYTKLEDIMKVSDMKFNLLYKYKKALIKFKKLEPKHQMIIDLYIFKNKSCYEVAEKLNVSIRSFFRILNKINKIWNEDSKNENKV